MNLLKLFTGNANPALAQDMQRVLSNLQSLSPAEAAPAMPTAAATPMFLSNYGRS